MNRLTTHCSQYMLSRMTVALVTQKKRKYIHVKSVSFFSFCVQIGYSLGLIESIRKMKLIDLNLCRRDYTTRMCLCLIRFCFSFVLLSSYLLKSCSYLIYAYIGDRFFFYVHLHLSLEEKMFVQLFYLDSLF